VIALIGQSVLDRIHWPEGQVEERLGGSPVFAARALAGSRARVITQGCDPALRRALDNFGHPVCVGPSRRTTVFDVQLHGDGSWHESITALGDPFTPGAVATWMAPALEHVSAVVCGAQWRGDFPPATLAALARKGGTVYLDGQGAARPLRLGPVRLEGPLEPSAVANVDVLKLSEDEAVALIGGIDPVAARNTGVPVVVVTRGEDGAIVLADGVATEVGVEPVVGLADTVGAGDSFLALMAAAATSGADPVLAAELACEGVARLLHARLAVEHEAALGATG
jgi:pfkB family carbohydrate kinase